MLPEAFPQHLVILGGGSAGWMAASYLDRSFNLPGRRRLEITLVESPDIGRIGVGEATIPSLRDFARYIGLDEATLMKRTSATFKHGIRFVDWNGPGTEYFHAFEAIENFRGFNPAPSWLARMATGAAGPFDEECGIQKQLALTGRAPKRMVDPDFFGQLPYAYHLDAEAFGDLLAEIAGDRGVTRIQQKVMGVDQNGDGDVTALRLADGTMIEGDFFIDCSGFSGFLINKTLGTPFESFGQYLLCDKAVAIPRPYGDGSSAAPYTLARALSNGWMWRIGLQTREGIGHVYSSRHIDPEAAERELRAAAAIPDEVPARHLDMRVGMPEVSWSRNVVAMGLAGGFIEPLESTGLHMVELALGYLVRYFPLSGINPAARDRFNQMMRERYIELRDFVAAHYSVTRRDDTSFWRDVRKPEHVPEGVSRRLALWSDRHPSSDDNDYSRLIFSHSNWQSVIYGLDAVGEEARANALRWCPSPGIHLERLEAALQQQMAALPPMSMWLEGLRTIPARDRPWNS